MTLKLIGGKEKKDVLTICCIFKEALVLEVSNRLWYNIYFEKKIYSGPVYFWNCSRKNHFIRSIYIFWN